MNARTWKFPLLLGVTLVVIEAFSLFVLATGAPSGFRWLGCNILSSTDSAVYLSYLQQGHDGHTFLSNLYAVEPHMRRLDPFWSIGGLLTRAGLEPLTTFHLLRFGMTFALVFALYAAAKSITTRERDARLATVLSLLGIGCGWIYSLYLIKTGVMPSETTTAADLVTEFSAGPMLFAGPHIILSIALLITGLRSSWNAICNASRRTAWIAAACLGGLFSFHPYFIPVFAYFFLIAFLLSRSSRPLAATIRATVPLIASGIPLLAIYAPLLFDTTFRTHHLSVNVLHLAAPLAWVATLAPFVVAFAWRWKNHIRIDQRERWILAWIAATVCALCLPLPWKRKMLEGVNVALVLLTLPAWVAVADWIATLRFRRLLAGTLLLAAGLGPLHVLTSQFALAAHPAQQTSYWFYAPKDVFGAWTYLHDRAGASAVVLTDDNWLNVWTPAYAGRTIWVGANHETPDYASKRQAWNDLMSTDDPNVATSILGATPVTHFVITSKASQERIGRWLTERGWKVAWTSGGVSVLERI